MPIVRLRDGSMTGSLSSSSGALNSLIARRASLRLTLSIHSHQAGPSLQHAYLLNSACVVTPLCDPDMGKVAVLPSALQNHSRNRVRRSAKRYSTQFGPTTLAEGGARSHDCVALWTLPNRHVARLSRGCAYVLSTVRAELRR
jgi:hypothetical protein